MDHLHESPPVIRDYLVYLETIMGRSPRTVSEYYLDLRTFFRYLKIARGLVPRSADIDEVAINDVDLDFVRTVSLTEVYDYLSFLSRDRVRNQRSRETEFGISAASRARKTVS